MRKGLRRALAAALIVALALLLSQLSGGHGTAHAQGTVNFDVDPDITGNSANTLGTVEHCVRVDVPHGDFGDGVADVTIDIVVSGDTQAPIAYDASLNYDSSKVHVAAPGTDPLIKMPAGMSLSDGLPDSDGTYHARALYFGVGSGTAGDGTIVRIDLDVISAGVTRLDLSGPGGLPVYASVAGVHPTTVGWGMLAINTDCSPLEVDLSVDSVITSAPADDGRGDPAKGDMHVSVSDTLTVTTTGTHSGAPLTHTVAATISHTVTAPVACTVNGGASATDSWSGDLAGLSSHDLITDFTIQCSQPGDHTFVVDNLITLVEADYTDPIQADNTDTETVPLEVWPPDVYVLLVNGIIAPPGDIARESVVNDVDHLSAAFAQELRTVSITTLGGSAGAGTPGTPAALDTAIATAFGPSGPNDLCIFYLGSHGNRVTDFNGDEADGLDGTTQIGAFWRLDDNMDTPFNASLAAGDCGAGMILMFMTCHSGELIVGANDFALGAPHVVTTSCTSPQVSRACVVGHNHSCYGGNGLVRGLTSVTGAPPARADGGGMDVTAAELHTYAVANDGDLTADPQSTAPASVLQALTYAAPAVHFSPVQQGEELFCNSGPLEPEPVGGTTELLVDGSESAPSAVDGSGSSSPPYAVIAGGIAAALVALTAGGWYARRRLS